MATPTKSSIYKSPRDRPQLRHRLACTPGFKARRASQAMPELGSVTGTFVDATFGRGGHSRALLPYLSDDARLFVLDKDPAAFEVARQLQQDDPRVVAIWVGLCGYAGGWG